MAADEQEPMLPLATQALGENRRGTKNYAGIKYNGVDMEESPHLKVDVTHRYNFNNLQVSAAVILHCRAAHRKQSC